MRKNFELKKDEDMEECEEEDSKEKMLRKDYKQMYYELLERYKESCNRIDVLKKDARQYTRILASIHTISFVEDY